MKTYSVKEISDMLNTNPETVRRWIREKKLDAFIESKKGGHIIYESALQAFLIGSPKYAAIASIANIPILLTGGLVTKKIIDANNIKNAKISDTDIIKFLEIQVNEHKMSIKNKNEDIAQLRMQIEAEESQIVELQKIISAITERKDRI